MSDLAGIELIEAMSDLAENNRNDFFIESSGMDLSATKWPRLSGC
jgi:hypothetical protein